MQLCACADCEFLRFRAEIDGPVVVDGMRQAAVPATRAASCFFDRCLYKENVMKWKSSLSGQAVGEADPRRHNTVLTARQAAIIGIRNSTFVLYEGDDPHTAIGSDAHSAVFTTSVNITQTSVLRRSKRKTHAYITDLVGLQAPNSTQIFMSQPVPVPLAVDMAASPWITLAHADFVQIKQVGRNTLKCDSPLHEVV